MAKTRSLGSFNDLPHEIAMGRVANVRNFSLDGQTIIASSGVDFDLTSTGEQIVILPALAGENFFIVSSAAGDNGKKVLVELLGPGGEYIEPFIVTLDAVDGTTEVQIADPDGSDQFSRVNELLSVDLVGFLGDVTIQRSGGGPGNLFSRALIANQGALNGLYTIPLNWAGTAQQVFCAMEKVSGGDANVTFQLQFKMAAQALWYKRFGIGLQRSGSTSLVYQIPAPNKLTGPFDIKLTAQSSGTTIGVYGNTEGKIERVGNQT